MAGFTGDHRAISSVRGTPDSPFTIKNRYAIQLRIPRAVDFTHAAGAERRQNLVVAETCAGG
jgi:hypothetical protein